MCVVYVCLGVCVCGCLYVVCVRCVRVCGVCAWVCVFLGVGMWCVCGCVLCVCVWCVYGMCGVCVCVLCVWIVCGVCGFVGICV